MSAVIVRYLLILLILPAPPLAAGGRIVVAAFSSGDLQGWQEEEFSGETRYTLVSDDGRRVLAAESRGTASGLYRTLRVDLHKTPYLHWSWKVANTLDGVNERSREGDDYPARVYVVFSGGLFFWRTRAINYVWSSNQPEGAEWPNAYADNARMIAVRSGDRQVGRWVTERRNVLEDYRRLFGEDIRYADAVAIMTDTDNSGQAARAFYGDIYFSEE